MIGTGTLGSWGRVVRLALAAAVAGGALAGCAPPDAAAEARAAQLRVSLPMQAQQLHLPAARTVVDLMIADLLYLPLGRRDPEAPELSDAPDDFLPMGALAWTLTPATRTATFRLDPAARFHDDTPVRARDWAFAWRVFRATPGPAQGRLSGVDTVWAVDSLTLAVRWRPEGTFASVMGPLVALPAARLDSIPLDRLAEHPLVRYPVGAGPWRVRADVSTEAALVLERLGADERDEGGDLRQIVLEPLTDPVLQQQALRQGTTDVLLPVRASHLEAVAAGGQQLLTLPARDYVFVGFAPQHPVLKDGAVRAALAALTPQDQILRTLFAGDVRLAKPLDGPWTSGQPVRAGVQAVAAHALDTTRARELLTAAGWQRGTGGTWERGGRPLAFRLMVPTSVATRRQVGQILEAVWRPFGIQVTLDEVEPAVFAERQQGRQFDAGVFTWHVEADASDLEGAWSCASAAAPRGANLTAWCDRVFDTAVQQARTTVGTTPSARATRAAAWATARAVLADRVPALWLYETQTAIAVSARLETAPWSGDAWWQSLGEWQVRPGGR